MVAVHLGANRTLMLPERKAGRVLRQIFDRFRSFLGVCMSGCRLGTYIIKHPAGVRPKLLIDGDRDPLRLFNLARDCLKNGF
jgi:hypothetical protein